MKKLLLLAVGVCIALSSFAQGTFMVKDIVPGTSSFIAGNFRKAGTNLYFDRRSSGPRELWKTNGTEAGTQLVQTFTKDIDEHDPFWARNSVDFNGKLVFTKYRDGATNVHELWVTDGTSAGTKYVSPNVTSTSIYRIEQLTVFNNAVYFVVESLDLVRGLYRWDGTNNPVKIVAEHTISRGLDHFIVVGDNKLFFIDGWKIYDATNAAAPVVLYDQSVVNNNGTGPSNTVYNNGKLIFVEGRSIEGSSIKGIRALDPVTKQHSFIKQELGFGFSHSTKLTPNLVKMGGSVYFHRVRSTGTITVPSYMYELWKIDPAFQVTLVKEIPSSSFIYPRVFMANSSSVIFSLEFTGGPELWKSNGTTAGTIPLIERGDNIQFPSDTRAFFLNNTQLLFPAQERTPTWPNTIHGIELWTSNFTKAGTRLAVDFNQGTNGGVYDTGFGSINNTSIIFAAWRRTPSQDLHGVELWSSDGSPIAVNGQIPPAPTLTSFTPATGPWGTSVVINGTNFTGASAVKFNLTYTTAFTVNSASKITVAVPNEATTGRISVVTPGGTVVSTSDFTVIQAATVTSFSPASAPVGTSVTITGTNFTGTSQVKFNSAVATTFKVNSATSLTATVPAGATTGPIIVTTPAGSVESGQNFIVAQPPTVTSFTPTSGPVNTVVTITGNHFLGTTGVKFNTTSATAFTINSNTSLTATVPAGATTGKITVTTAGGTVLSGGTFTVAPAQPPTITGISPASGAVGTLVTLTGTNFQATSVVKFNATTAVEFTVPSATTIVATVPAGATTGKISVTTPAGTVQSSGTFTLTTAPAGPPTIASFSPASATLGGIVTITGTNFSRATGVAFNGIPALGFTFNSDASIFVEVPQDAQSGKLSVSAPAGTAMSSGNFSVIQPTSRLVSGLVKDINPGNAPSLFGPVHYFTPFRNHIYFNTYIDGYHQLWRTDGTASGTIKVVNRVRFVLNALPYTASNKFIYFFEVDESNRARFVVMDENLNKQELSNIQSVNDTYALLNNKAIFEKNADMWVFDEVTNTSKMLYDFNPFRMVAHKGIVYFYGSTPTGYAIGRTDGTAAGTWLIGGGSITAHSFMFAGDYVYYGSPEPGTSESVIYRTDGTAAGTIKLTGFKGDIDHFTEVNGTLFFNGRVSGTSSVGYELYKVVGTTVQLVKDINPGVADGVPDDGGGSLTLKPVSYNNQVFFRGRNSQGNELWKSDGTSAGTQIVKDIIPGSGDSYPAWFKVAGNKIYFSARTGSSDGKLYVSDGTEAGTKEVGLPTYNITHMGYLNGSLFFSGFGGIGVGQELFVYNLQGTATGVKEFAQSGVKLYPNPTQDQVNLLLPKGNPAWSVTVLNQLGQEVQKIESVKTTKLALDMRTYASGVYILLLSNGTDAFVTKVVKQ